MAAILKTCPECGTAFYARADAVYCSSRCRQRVYRRKSSVLFCAHARLYLWHEFAS